MHYNAAPVVKGMRLRISGQLMIFIDNKTLLASGEFEDPSLGQLFTEEERFCDVIRSTCPRPPPRILKESCREFDRKMLLLFQQNRNHPEENSLAKHLTNSFLPVFEMVTVAQ